MINDIELMEAFTRKSLHLAAEVKHRKQSVHVGWMIFVQGLEVLSIKLRPTMCSVVVSLPALPLA